MEFRELIRERYSVRQFDPRPVEPELVATRRPSAQYVGRLWPSSETLTPMSTAPLRDTVTSLKA